MPFAFVLGKCRVNPPAIRTLDQATAIA